MNTKDQQRYGTALSQVLLLKIGELKRLVNKYPRYCTNSDIRLAIYISINRDDTLLDGKLEQLELLTGEYMAGLDRELNPLLILINYQR